jgi:hypothetical protein
LLECVCRHAAAVIWLKGSEEATLGAGAAAAGAGAAAAAAGVVFNRAYRSISFTKNGQHLGVAVRDKDFPDTLNADDLCAMVGWRTTGAFFGVGCACHACTSLCLYPQPLAGLQHAVVSSG